MMLNITEKKLELELISPVTLNSDWSRLTRLLLLASLAAVGSVGNVFMISAVMIEDFLRRRGNTFVVNVALADLLVTGLVIPASAVVILAGLPGNLSVCRFEWFVATLSFLVTVLSHMAIATENYMRLCSTSTNIDSIISRRKITVILLIFWIIATIVSGLQFAPELSFDYCTRQTTGRVPYLATISTLVVFLPILITLFNYIRTIWAVRRAKRRPNLKLPVTFNWDVSLMYTNIYSFLLMVVFWLPFGIVLAMASIKRVPDSLFYKLAWLAITKSCINSILYCATNRHFRAAYVNLFHYCCCKTTVTFSRRQRPEGVRPSGDVRVHIIPGYNMYCSPQRGREGQSKRFTGRSSSGRDVYEL